MIVANVMLDHPSWLTTLDGTVYRAVRHNGGVASIVASSHPTGGCLVQTSPGEHPPVLDLVDPVVLNGPTEIATPLRDAGCVARLANPDLWDALATAIVRQVIQARQARKLYRRFCHEHGDKVSTPVGRTWLFPSPQTVLALPDEEYTRLGMAFKRRPLQAAAQAYLDHGHRWSELDPGTLIEAVQAVPRIGPWTAGAAVADATNDYSLYPFADLAVRTWAKRLTPGRTWPDTEPEFAVAWQRLAGEQLSAWTLLTLAWGVSRARTDGAVAL